MCDLFHSRWLSDSPTLQVVLAQVRCGQHLEAILRCYALILHVVAKSAIHEGGLAESKPVEPKF